MARLVWYNWGWNRCNLIEIVGKIHALWLKRKIFGFCGIFLVGCCWLFNIMPCCASMPVRRLLFLQGNSCIVLESFHIFCFPFCCSTLLFIMLALFCFSTSEMFVFFFKEFMPYDWKGKFLCFINHIFKFSGFVVFQCHWKDCILQQYTFIVITG